MEPPHTGVELASTIFDCLKEWGIEKNFFSITLDNASFSGNMVDILKDHLCLQNSLLCGGKFIHVHCSVRILNLIAQEGSKVATESLYKIRKSIKYVRRSDGRMKKISRMC